MQAIKAKYGHLKSKDELCNISRQKLSIFPSFFSIHIGLPLRRRAVFVHEAGAEGVLPLRRGRCRRGQRHKQVQRPGQQGIHKGAVTLG